MSVSVDKPIINFIAITARKDDNSLGIFSFISSLVTFLNQLTQISIPKSFCRCDAQNILRACMLGSNICS